MPNDFEIWPGHGQDVIIRNKEAKMDRTYTVHRPDQDPVTYEGFDENFEKTYAVEHVAVVDIPHVGRRVYAVQDPKCASDFITFLYNNFPAAKLVGIFSRPRD